MSPFIGNAREGKVAALGKFHLRLFLGVISIGIWDWATPAQAKTEHKLYTAENSTEAIMSFNHRVEIRSSVPPSDSLMQETIEQQLTHLFGPMGEAPYPGVPKGDHRLRVYPPKMIKKDLYQISYVYKGTIVLRNGPEEFLTVLLPNNPSEIYERAMVGKKNPCTDPHYQSEGDFWYFWNPYQRGCPLQEGVDYQKVKARIQRKSNTLQSFPEYDRLVRPGAQGQAQIPIRIFLGMDKANNLTDPFTSKDINAQTFLAIKSSLVKNGYQNRVLNLKEVAPIIGLKSKPQGHLEEFRKKLGGLEIVVEMYFGPTGIQEGSRTFHHLLKDSIEKGSVFIYDGHSGLGGHLDISSIESLNQFQIHFDKSNYQIFYFNSCSSYPYYNTMYFASKASRQDPRGSKNLDILTNGLSTYFSVLDGTTLVLVSAIEYWASGKATISYQEIAKRIDSGNLFGINGDEDNPTTPK